jgi:hypothetical protein
MCLEALQDQYPRIGYEPYEREERKTAGKERKIEKWLKNHVNLFISE